MEMTRKKLSYREALYIYSSLAIKSNNSQVKKIKECYNIGVHQLNSLVDKYISDNANFESKQYKIKFSESFKRIRLKQINLAKNNLIDEDKLKWIHSLNRQESFMLDRLLQDEVNSLKISPQISSIRGRLIDHDKLNLELLEQTKNDEDKNFLQFKSIFIIDNLMGDDKDKIINTLHEIKIKIKQVKKITSWYNKEVETGKYTFIDWFSSYIHKNPVPIGTGPSLTEIQGPNYDIDFWLFTFGLHHTSDNGNLELYFRTMKGAWSQKKYRDSNNGKKACSFQLNEKNIKLLSRLCEVHKRNKNEMIEILIEDACEEDGIIKRPNRR